MTTPAQRAALAKGTPTRQARTALKRDLACGRVRLADVVAGQTEHEPAAAGLTLEQLLTRMCGLGVIDAHAQLAAADAVALAGYALEALPAERRAAIAAAWSDTGGQTP